MFSNSIHNLKDVLRLTAAGFLALATASPLAAQPQVINENQILIASDGMQDDKFGFAVDREGDTMIIGAPQHYSNSLPGSFYVFARDQAGHWSEQARVFSDFKPGQAEFGDLFGHALALEGDSLLVGAPFTELNGTMLVGLVYAFARDQAGTWTQQQTLLPDDSNITRFGEYVAMIGNTAVLAGISRAFVYTRDGSGSWTQQAELMNIDFESIHAVAFDGTRIAVTGQFANGDVGARVFANSGGTWSSSNPIIVQQGLPGLANARGVSLDGDRLALGVLDAINQDRAFVYSKTEAGDWVQEAMLDPDNIEGDSFGIDVWLKGDLLLVGASNAGSHGITHVFKRNSGGTWTPQMQLLPSDTFAHNFGAEVQFSDGVPVIGSWAHFQNGLYSGAVYVFEELPTQSGADITGDGVVNAADLLAVINNWGSCPAPPSSCAADISPAPDGDGVVNSADLLMVINNWG
jgi:hypothetical protein